MRIDYHPFGMVMPDRQFVVGDSYRYGFNGKENDNEAKGIGNQLDYGMRIYDSRLGRFLSVDPLFKVYPWNSTFAFAENDVIRSIDLEGGEKYIVTGRTWQNSDGVWLTNYTWITLPKPGPLGSGILVNIIIENGGKQFQLLQYLPSLEDKKNAPGKKTRWQRFWDKILDGGANEKGGGGCSQAYGIIITSSEGGVGTTSGAGDKAEYFDVMDKGILGFVGGAGGGLSVVGLEEEAKRSISKLTKVIENLSSGTEAAVESFEQTLEQIENTSTEAATPNSSRENTKLITTKTVKASPTKVKVKQVSIFVDVEWHGKTKDGNDDSVNTSMKTIPVLKKGKQ